MAVDDGAVEVVVEIPKGSRNKYEIDHETGHVWLDRHLFAACMPKPAPCQNATLRTISKADHSISFHALLRQYCAAI